MKTDLVPHTTPHTEKNQTQLLRARRKINAVLCGILCVLFASVVWVISDELAYYYRLLQPLRAEKIQLVREKNTVVLEKNGEDWRLTAPYQQQASGAVVKALLEYVQHGCRTLESAPARTPEDYARLLVDDTTYALGERNQVSDEIYVKRSDTQGESWLLCDKILIAMAMSPTINFVDKSLYQGELTAIRSTLGQVSDLSGLDLSVLEVAPADAEALPTTGVSTLSFIADNTHDYRAFQSEDKQHLLLFDSKKSLIYVIAAQPKLTAILGL